MTKPNDGQPQDQPVPMKKGSYEFATVCPDLWRDKEFKRLTIEQRYVWLHLLTSPARTHFPGLARTTIREVAAVIDLSFKKVSATIAKLTELRWVEFDEAEEVMYLPNGLKYNPPDNPKQLIHWVRVWSSFPDCSLKGQALDALRHACELSPDFLAVIDQEVELGPYKDRPKPRKNRSGSKGQHGRGTDTVSGTVAPTVAQTSPIPFTTHHSPLTNVEVQEQLPSPPPAGDGAVTGPARPSFATETPPTTPQPAAPARTTPAVDSAGQASLLPAAGKPDRRRKPAGEPDSRSEEVARYLARWNELKQSPFPVLSFSKEEAVVFNVQRTTRSLDELLWVLETLHNDKWFTKKTILECLSPQAAQQASGVAAAVTVASNAAASQPSKFVTGRNLEALWKGEA